MNKNLFEIILLKNMLQQFQNLWYDDVDDDYESNRMVTMKRRSSNKNANK